MLEKKAELIATFLVRHSAGYLFNHFKKALDSRVLHKTICRCRYTVQCVGRYVRDMRWVGQYRDTLIHRYIDMNIRHKAYLASLQALIRGPRENPGVP